MDDENQIQQAEDKSQDVSLLSKDDILALVKRIVDDSTEDRLRAIQLVQQITEKDFDGLMEIGIKGDTVAKLLDIANKSTSELNKLLGTIQRFHSDKKQEENVEKILSAGQIGNVLTLLDQLNVGPSKYTGTTISEQQKQALKEVQKDFKKDDIDYNYVDMEDVDSDE